MKNKIRYLFIAILLINYNFVICQNYNKGIELMNSRNAKRVMTQLIRKIPDDDFEHQLKKTVMKLNLYRYIICPTIKIDIDSNGRYVLEEINFDKLYLPDVYVYNIWGKYIGQLSSKQTGSILIPWNDINRLKEQSSLYFYDKKLIEEQSLLKYDSKAVAQFILKLNPDIIFNIDGIYRHLLYYKEGLLYYLDIDELKATLLPTTITKLPR